MGRQPLFSRGKMKFVALLVGVVPVFALTACGAASQTPAKQKASGAAVQIDVFSPFSGANAFIGTTFNLPPVKMGAALINAAGGINGHPVSVIATDSGTDPADALPAIQRLFVQHSGVAGMLGLDSSNAPALAPVMNSHKVVTMSLAGTASLDKNTNAYFFRLASPDSMMGTALAQSALHFGYKKVALIFDSSGTSQSDVPGIVKEYTNHGGNIALNETVQVDQASYRTEVAKLKAAHVQALITETDPQTAATLYANMKQLGVIGIPVIGGAENDVAAYFTSVAKAVGGMAAESKFMYVENFAPATAPGQAYFNAQWAKADPKGGAPVPPQYALYDGLNIMALAMDEAHSSTPSVYLHFMKKVTYNPGGEVVSNYAQGLAALNAGKKIQYEGASGQLVFNKYNWPPQGFELLKLTPKGALKSVYKQTSSSVGAYFK
ncbi:MAG TPA: ABC transporter substrate-binding protein [Acidimicrobiales bacterium]|nr:ABC transporter substrate-binding protein [Acidimicrobiales bacterium]